MFKSARDWVGTRRRRRQGCPAVLREGPMKKRMRGSHRLALVGIASVLTSLGASPALADEGPIATLGSAVDGAGSALSDDPGDAVGVPCRYRVLDHLPDRRYRFGGCLRNHGHRHRRHVRRGAVRRRLGRVAHGRRRGRGGGARRCTGEQRCGNGLGDDRSDSPSWRVVRTEHLVAQLLSRRSLGRNARRSHGVPDSAGAWSSGEHAHGSPR